MRHELTARALELRQNLNNGFANAARQPRGEIGKLKRSEGVEPSYTRDHAVATAIERLIERLHVTRAKLKASDAGIPSDGMPVFASVARVP